MKNKKTFTLFVVAISLIGLTACGNTKSSSTKQSSTIEKSSKINEIYATKNKIINPEKGTMEIVGFMKLSYENKPAYAVEWKFTNTSKELVTADDIDTAKHSYFQKDGNSEKSIYDTSVYLNDADQANENRVNEDDTVGYNKAVYTNNAWATVEKRSGDDKIEPGKSINILGDELLIPNTTEDIKCQIGGNNETDSQINFEKDNFTFKYLDLTNKTFSSDMMQEIQDAITAEQNKNN